MEQGGKRTKRMRTCADDNTRHSAPKVHDALSRRYTIRPLNHPVIDGRGRRVDYLHSSLEGGLAPDSRMR